MIRQNVDQVLAREDSYFYVYVVESPSDSDFVEDRAEGHILGETLRLSRIPVYRTVAINSVAFEEALGTRLAASLEIHAAGIPILHLSVHGSEDGIELSDKDFMEWEELRDLLPPINQALNGYLVVCLSCCHGYSGSRMAMYEHGRLPFYALVTHTGSPEWRDTLIGFSVFYHLLSKGKEVREIIPAMNAAAGDSGFVFELGEQTREGFIQYVKDRRRQQAAVRNLSEQLEDFGSCVGGYAKPGWCGGLET